MTIRQEEIEYYRTEVIGKYVTPIMEQYANEEIEYKNEQERVMRLPKGVRKNT